MTDASDPPPLPSDPRTGDDTPVDAAPAEPTVGPPAPPPPDEQVLARGHLHPAILLLRLIDAMRQAAFPLLLGITVEPWFLVAALVLFVLQLGASVVRYLTLEYTLTAEELRIRDVVNVLKAGEDW